MLPNNIQNKDIKFGLYYPQKLPMSITRHVKQALNSEKA
jgi:hypothetical protein